MAGRLPLRFGGPSQECRMRVDALDPPAGRTDHRHPQWCAHRAILAFRGSHSAGNSRTAALLWPAASALTGISGNLGRVFLVGDAAHRFPPGWGKPSGYTLDWSGKACARP